MQNNSNVKSWKDYSCQPLWNNNKFKIGNHPPPFFKHKSWYVEGVRCVIDLFDENKNFSDIEMLKRKFNIQTNYFIQLH